MSYKHSKSFFSTYAYASAFLLCKIVSFDFLNNSHSYDLIYVLCDASAKFCNGFPAISSRLTLFTFKSLNSSNYPTKATGSSSTPFLMNTSLFFSRIHNMLGLSIAHLT